MLFQSIRKSKLFMKIFRQHNCYFQRVFKPVIFSTNSWFILTWFVHNQQTISALHISMTLQNTNLFSDISKLDGFFDTEYFISGFKERHSV